LNTITQPGALAAASCSAGSSDAVEGLAGEADFIQARVRRINDGSKIKPTTSVPNFYKGVRNVAYVPTNSWLFAAGRRYNLNPL
jgi:hypothetical protein